MKKNNNITPITPKEASVKRLNSIEPEMIQAVNELLTLKLDESCTYATIPQKDIIERYFKIKGIEQTPTLRSDLFERHQLDFEKIFTKAGWNVRYDRPAYYETYEPSFKFEKKKQNNES